jgi:hypothetical protein
MLNNTIQKKSLKNNVYLYIRKNFFFSFRSTNRAIERTINLKSISLENEMNWLTSSLVIGLLNRAFYFKS